MRWYFNVALRTEGMGQVRLYRYRGEWYDRDGTLQDSKDDGLDILLTPRQLVSYPDLWVTSALPQFTYRMTIFGRDAHGRDVHAVAVLHCQ
jgi:hypothetical protein